MPPDNEDDDILCKFCMEEAQRSDVIVPCNCKGSIKYVHPSCLNSWRASSSKATSFSQCDQCGFRYEIKRLHITEKVAASRKKKFIWLVARDALIAFCFLQLALFLLAGVVRVLDPTNSLLGQFDEDYIQDEWIAAYLEAILIAVFFIGLYGLTAHGCEGGNRCLNNCNSNDCRCSSGGGSGVVALMVVVILAVGVYSAVILTYEVVRDIGKKHYHVLKKRQQAEIDIVIDREGIFDTSKLLPKDVEDVEDQ